MTLTQALNITRIYSQKNMDKYNIKGGVNLSFFINDLNDYELIIIKDELSKLYPGIIEGKEGKIIIKSLAEAFHLFQCELSRYMNSISSQFVVTPCNDEKFNNRALLPMSSNNSELTHDIDTDYERVIDIAISMKEFGLDCSNMHIQDLQYMLARKAKAVLINEIINMETEDKLTPYGIEKYNTTKHTILNLKGLLNYFKNSKL